MIQVPEQWASGIATFDGVSWRPPLPYPDWGVQDIAIGDGKLIAVGGSSVLCDQTPCAGPTPVRDVVVRDPSFRPLFAWKTGMRGLLGPSWTEVMSLHVHRGGLYAGGYFWDAASPPSWLPTGGLVRWTGDGWVPVGNGSLRGWVERIGSYGDWLVIGGAGGFVAEGAAPSTVLLWDGARWNDLGGVLEGSVMGLTEWQGALVAAGGVRLPGQTTWSGVAIHQNAGWKILGEPLVTDQLSVNDVATFGGELYVAGSGLEVAGTPHGLLRWDGAHWATVPNAPEGSVRSLLPREDGLWVGLVPAGLYGGSVWRWDGTHWTQMGDLVGDRLVLTEAGGEVVAAGLLYTPLGSCSLARWTGTEWIPIPGGPAEGVETMATLGSDLYLGGSFRRTEAQQSEGLARWSFETEQTAPSVESIETWPSPVRDRVAFRLGLMKEGRATVELYDLRGSLVATALDEALPAGYSERSWAIPHERMPAGVYFARVRVPTATWSRKIVVVP